jgi:hypothetical protein
MRALFLIALLPLAAKAQLVMYAVNGSTETLVTSTYQFGQVALNTTSAQQFRIYNTGISTVSVNVTLGGAGFAFTAPPLPVSIPGNSTVGQTLNITVSFTPTSTANYSANLQISSLSVILLGSGIAAPTLSATAGCSSGTFNFGTVQVGGSSACAFALSNSNPQAVTVASVVVNGLGFSGPVGVIAPLTLQAGQSVSFSVTFSPQAAIVYSGTLVVGTQSYAITGTGATAPIPTPVLQFDSGAFASGQQRVLTISIPGGSPAGASGYVNIAFTPSTAAVQDDTQVMFLAHGSRSIPFTVAAGSAQVLLNGQSSATFQTGTTEGTIAFTMTTTSTLAGDPTTKVTIPGAGVMIDSTTASKERTGYLDITIVGADNTYSAGAMSFAFFDTNGNAISSAVNADFTSAFKSFYGGQTAGSSFKILVSFPVVGSVSGIGSVKVTMTNAAGVANTGGLTFN